VLELSGGVRSPKREPWWNADRRAAPEAQADGNIGLRGADDDPQLRLSAFRFPLFFAWPGWKSGSNFGEAGLSEE